MTSRQNLSHTSKLDSTAEDWEELTVTKTQCKKEYTLARGGLIRQFIDCCLETNTSSPWRRPSCWLRWRTLRSISAVPLSLSQQQDEGIRHYIIITRLRGLTSRCNFTIKCKTRTSPTRTQLLDLSWSLWWRDQGGHTKLSGWKEPESVTSQDIRVV